MRHRSVREQRATRLHEPHIAPLTKLVEQLCTERPDDSVPYFDPESGGQHAKVLLLLEAPGPKAAPAPEGSNLISSGFVSLDNDDPTAAALCGLVERSDLQRDELLMWNIVPWYLGNESHTQIHPAKGKDLDEGAVWLGRLIELTDKLKVAVLLGQKAQLGWFRVATRIGRPVPVLGCPHPSAQSLNSNPEARGLIDETLRVAAEFAR